MSNPLVSAIILTYNSDEYIDDLNPENLAQKTKRLIKSRQELKRYSESALKNSRNYNWDKTTDKIEQELEEVK